MKNISEQTERAAIIVQALLQEEGPDPERFMQDFEAQGSMLANLDLVKHELEEFNQKVIRLTSQAMPLLVQRGIVEHTQSSIVSKIIMHQLADRMYNPKLYHASWWGKARQIVNFITNHLSWR